MKYRTLGRTGLSISEIGIGCSGYWGQKLFDEQKAHQIIHAAFDRGVNFFDTGHNYCNFNAEPRLGRALLPMIRQHGRSAVVISTKAGTKSGQASVFRRGAQTQLRDFSPDGIEASLVASIKNLDCEYLDIFQLHGPGEHQLTDELLLRLDNLKKSGLFRHLGITTHTSSVLEYLCQYPDIFDVVLTDYNALNVNRESVISRMASAGIGVLAGTVLAQGHLVKGKIGRLRAPSDAFYLLRSLVKNSNRALLERSRSMQGILAGIPGITAAQAAFAFVLKPPGVASGVFGTTSLQNLAEILSVTDMGLADEFADRIRRSSLAYQD